MSGGPFGRGRGCLVFLLLFVGGLTVLVALAAAQEKHDPKSPAHWYPPNCCSQRDCEPLPIDGVIPLADGGYHVVYVSERFGAVDEMIKRTEVRESKDGGFHGCWRLNPETKPRTICFFEPLNA